MRVPIPLKYSVCAIGTVPAIIHLPNQVRARTFDLFKESGCKSGLEEHILEETKCAPKPLPFEVVVNWKKGRKELMSIATILLIEDSIADVLVLRHCLDQVGKEYQLKILTDGEEVLQFIEEHRRRSEE